MSIATLATLASRLPVPDDYFSGLRAPSPVRADNLLLFFRDGFSKLRQRALENLSHHRFVLLVPLRGSADVNMDGADRRLAPGSAMLVFPFQFHFFLRPGPGALRWLVMTFDSDSPESLAPLRDTPVRFSPDALRRMESLLRAFLKNKPDAGAEVRLTAEILLQKLVRTARIPSSLREPKKAAPGTAGAWIAHVNTRLHAAGPGAGRISKLAVELGVSERLLRLRFSENFGVSLGVYIRNFQLNNAAGLLSRSDLPVGEIARRCGYASQAAFTRAFRVRTGFAPKDYRADRRG